MLRRRANDAVDDDTAAFEASASRSGKNLSGKPLRSGGGDSRTKKALSFLQINLRWLGSRSRVVILLSLAVTLVLLYFYQRKSLVQSHTLPSPNHQILISPRSPMGTAAAGPLVAKAPTSALNTALRKIEISFQRRTNVQRSPPLELPASLDTSEDDDEENKADYGALEIIWLNSTRFRRRIRKRDDKVLQHERKALFRAMNDYAIPDEYLPDEELSYPLECERPTWKFASKPICNTIHEIVRNLDVDKYLGHGYYRDAWLMPDLFISRDDNVGGPAVFVLKQTRLPKSNRDEDHGPNPKSFSKVQREAVIMEQLTSSPRIVTTYGHCALTVLSENVPFEVAISIVPNSGHANQTILDQLPAARSMNNYTTTEVLHMTIEMSEAIADLHGYPGTIVHGDIHPVQWLRSTDGSLKLNDFNNAEIMDWNRERHTYCKTDRGTWGGMYRSPEEFLGEPIDDKVDVYSMGNNIYTLLTGLWPFYEYSKYADIQAKILKQERPYIDDRLRNRGYVEHSLIEIMERMWEHKPEDRPSIFEVVAFLQQVRQNASQIMERAS